MNKRAHKDFNKAAFAVRTQIAVMIAIHRGFCKTFGALSGTRLFFSILFRLPRTKREILSADDSLPKDPVLDMAALVLTAYRAVINKLGDDEKTHLALRKAYVEPYAITMRKVLLSSLDAPFEEIVTFFDWGFGLFAPWVKRQQLRTDSEHYDFNITACKFAQIFHTMGCPQVTPLICAIDISLYEGLSHISMQRTKTIGTGGDHCDFRFSRQKKADLIKLKRHR